MYDSTKDRVAHRLSPISSFGGIGFFIMGNILIIGEQSGDKQTDRPFCAATHCSEWLNNKLNLHSIPEDKLYWINALRTDDTQADIAGLITELQPSYIICLGNIAERVCRDQRINNFIKFYHPQYWKRFRSREEYPFVIELAKMVGELEL